MVYKQMIILTIIGVMVLKCTDSQTFPENPCPDLFQYLNADDLIYGRMEFPNDNSGYYKLSVNMSVAVNLTHNKNIDIELRTSANDLSLGRSVVYHVYFPVQTIVPKPTLIEFNNRVYCAGPPEELRPGGGVTNMWTTIHYGFSPPPVNRHIIANTPIELPQFPEVPQFTKPRPPFSIPTTKSPNAIGNIDTATITNVATMPKVRIDNECGFSTQHNTTTQQLVVNGDKVENGEYPWIVAIMYKQNLNYKYRCTGSLVSTQHVITAAHCVWFFNAPLVKFEDMSLIFGQNSIRNRPSGALIRAVENIVAHPNYTDTRPSHYDMAILTTNKPVEFSQSVKPVCLWQGDEDLDIIVGEKGIVVGWGMDETGRNFVTEAKQIHLPVVTTVACLRSNIRFYSITSESTFCAGNRDGSGPCTGDSGAGFVMNRNGRWFLRGVASISQNNSKTCDLHNYFVFADAAKVKSWIKEIIA